jgi:hypothetical protein
LKVQGGLGSWSWLKSRDTREVGLDVSIEQERAGDIEPLKIDEMKVMVDKHRSLIYSSKGMA